MRLRTRLACLGAGLALATSAVVIPAVEESSAAFTDAEHASVSMEAVELVAPQARDCQTGLLSTSATLRWTAPATGTAAYSYQWQVLNSGGSVTSSGTYASTVTQHDVEAGLLGVLTTSTFRVRTVSANWQSPWQEAQITTILGALGLVLIGTCSWQ
ncbi:fibronectin type III domain-containing protein [Ruania zhangjianzhongii]|uniref:fibronectin type III domain-containing protein n=1 Tax=Ruania zhangjianzhongii TaxID=2603206 RepID=UPI0011C7268F|nr:fibronectin type III domain-containing protein [Ruania zhangjianzhongii]